MNKNWIVMATVPRSSWAFVVGAVVYRDRAGQEAAQAAQANDQALVRPHSPVFGNPSAKVTIVEFFDPACETCRAFYPIVKGIVNSSFGQVRLVARYAPLHRARTRPSRSSKRPAYRASTGKRSSGRWPSSPTGPRTATRSPNGSGT